MSMGAMGPYKVSFDGGYAFPLFTDGGKTAMDAARLFTAAGFPATAYQWLHADWAPIGLQESEANGSSKPLPQVKT